MFQDSINYLKNAIRPAPGGRIRVYYHNILYRYAVSPRSLKREGATGHQHPRIGFSSVDVVIKDPATGPQFNSFIEEPRTDHFRWTDFDSIATGQGEKLWQIHQTPSSCLTNMTGRQAT
ncbi:hypothetical protein Leryth_002217 [Lithospermum erythrorhizon]|nr:hypothetical protein Leryth_002217 [Lithospermum erythrorhizon]